MSNAAQKSGVPATNERARSFGKKCNRIYESMLRRLNVQKNPEAVLRWISVAARFAWTFHVGRYADGRIENAALEIGRRLDEILPECEIDSLISNARLASPDRRRVLHVATTLYGIGGHSRLIRSWIQNDKSSEHSLLLTAHETEVPHWIVQSVTESEGDLICLPTDSSFLEKARVLRGITQRYFDVVVLHHHPNDVVPVVAFAADDGPPVALTNQADHVFWLGTSVSDVVLNLRGFATRISETRRFAQKNLLLSVPLSIPSLSLTKAEARRRLDIPTEQTVLLSIGTRYKFTPSETHNFFVTTGKILKQNPGSHLYIIGIDQMESGEYLKYLEPERVHFLGTVEDPVLYRLSADLYLDSMPYGSMIALLETAALGVCPVLMYAPPAPQYDLSEQVAFSGLVTCAGTEDEYIDKVNQLIAHPEARQEIGAAIREGVRSYHQGEEWSEYLARVYEQLEAGPHRTAAIPNAGFMQTADDLAVCDFNSVRYANGSLIRQMVASYLNVLTLGDLINLFLISLRMRDNNFSYKEARLWLQLFGHKLFR